LPHVPPRRTFDPAAIDEFARGQGGIVTFAQLRELGMPKSTISRWTRTGGRWQRLLPAVYLIHRGRPTADERLHAAVHYSARSAMFTGLAALHLHGLRNVPVPLADARLHLLVPARQQTQSAGFVLLERTTRLPHSTVRGGFPVAPLPRALFDAGRRTPDRQSIRGFVLEAVQRRLIDIDDLRAEVVAGPRQWTALLRDTLGEGAASVRSEPEAALRSLIRGSGLEEPLWNPRLETPAGEFIAEPDGYYPALALALEVDSRRYHFTNSDHYDQTWRRHARYAAHGIAVLRLMPVDISRNPRAVRSTIRAAMAAQAGKPLPPLRVVRRAA
jgi:very-short-patch-repair endonuclease